MNNLFKRIMAATLLSRFLNQPKVPQLPMKLDLQFFAEPTMDAWEAIHGAQGRAFVTIEGNRYRFANLINLDADMTKTKSKIPIMGRIAKGNKSTGAEYEGNATFHFNTSIFRQLLKRYKETGEDIYFDIQVTNEDGGSGIGRQTTILIGCNLDGGKIAKLDADAEYLEEEVSFTFEDWDMPEEFSILKSMQS